MPSPWFYQAQLTLLGVLHPPWRWLVASRWQIFVKLRAGWPPTCSLDSIAFVFVFSPQIGRSTERPQFSAGLLYCILQALLSSSIPSAARRGGASDARPSLDESVRTGRELGAICSDLSGSHMCICHGIAFFVHCFRVYLWFFLFTNFYLLILKKKKYFHQIIFFVFIYILYNVEFFNHWYTYSNFQLHFFN